MANISVRDFQFQGNPIRCLGTDRDVWFIARDVCEALSIAWRGMATLESIPPEWIGVRKLRTPMRQRDGTLRVVEVDAIVIRDSAVYKLAFRSNKPSADAFTNWVAGEVLPAIQKTGQYVSKRREKYEKQGKQLEWIDQREGGIEVRKDFTTTLKDHEVKNQGYADCTNAIYKPVLGGTATLVKVKMGLKPKANLRDSLSTIDLATVKLAELLAAKRIEDDNLNGNEPCKQACALSGEAVAAATKIASSGELPG